MSFEPINTQEEFDAKISERIKRAQESVEKKYQDYDALKAKAEQADTFQKALDDQKAELENQITKLKSDHEAERAAWDRERLKTKLANEFHLPSELAGRLQGDDEEALRKDAESISKLMVQNKRPAPLRSTEGTVTDSKDAALSKMLHDMKGE